MNIIKNKYHYFIASGIFVFISLFLLFGTKLNLGIDMTGGTQMEYSYETIDIDIAREQINIKSNDLLIEDAKVINATSVYKITGENKLSVVIGFDNTIEDKILNELKNTFREDVLAILKSQDSTVIETKYTNIGKSFGDYIKNTAILTLIIAVIAIAFYVTFAFSGVVTGINLFSFSGITIITLFHDVLIASGLYIFISMFFPEFKIDTFFITALLTILGYSINDTIVIFDRIRANLKNIGKSKKNLKEIINLSISQSLRRSIYTSLTLLFVLVTIFFFGPETIKGFTLVMILGTLVGTYSSIFLASPLLYEMNKNKNLRAYKKVIVKPEDKIVV